MSEHNPDTAAYVARIKELEAERDALRASRDRLFGSLKSLQVSTLRDCDELRGRIEAQAATIRELQQSLKFRRRVLGS